MDTNISEDPAAASNFEPKCGLPITLCHKPEDHNLNTVKLFQNMWFLIIHTSLKAGELIKSKYYFCLFIQLFLILYQLLWFNSIIFDSISASMVQQYHIKEQI